MNKELAKTIGAAARQARTALRITQEDAADRINVSVEFYARIERGSSLPSILTFVRIASALGASADTLIGRSAAPTLPREWPARQPEDSPEVRRVIRRVHKATPGGLRVVNSMLKELEIV